MALVPGTVLGDLNKCTPLQVEECLLRLPDLELVIFGRLYLQRDLVSGRYPHLQTRLGGEEADFVHTEERVFIHPKDVQGVPFRFSLKLSPSRMHDSNLNF